MRTITMKKNTRTIKIGIFLDIPGLARTRAISGLYRFARQRPDWRIFQFPVHHDVEDLRRLVADFMPDAIFAGHADAIRAYDAPIPYVLLENIEPVLPPGVGATLNLDNIQLGYAAAERLHSLGYRNFGYLGIVFNPTVSSRQMPTRYSKIRCGAFELASTDVGGSAWRTDSTEIRGIARLGVSKFDEYAMVRRTVNVPA